MGKILSLSTQFIITGMVNFLLLILFVIVIIMIIRLIISDHRCHPPLHIYIILLLIINIITVPIIIATTTFVTFTALFYCWDLSSNALNTFCTVKTFFSLNAQIFLTLSVYGYSYTLSVGLWYIVFCLLVKAHKVIPPDTGCCVYIYTNYVQLSI